MAASNFANCLAFTLRYEGGRADDPRDPGGRTNQGVTQRTYDGWRAKRGLSARDVYAMEAAERDALYRAGFWQAVKADALPPGADLALFDFGVNSGPARALKAYARCTGGDDAATVKAICAARLSFLHALGTFRTFGRGWTARVAACEALGVKMAEHARIGVPAEAPATAQVAGALQAAGQVAGATARRRAAAAGVVTAAAAMASPAAAGAAHLSRPMLAAGGAILAVLVALILWRAHQAKARATAYAAIALAAESSVRRI